MCYSEEKLVSLFSGVGGFRLADTYGMHWQPKFALECLADTTKGNVARVLKHVIEYVEKSLEELLSVTKNSTSIFGNPLENNDIYKSNNSIGFMNGREEQLVMADLEGCEFWDEESRRAAFVRYACVLDFDISDELRTRIRGLRADISQLAEARQAALQQTARQEEERRKEALLRRVQRMFRCDPTAARNFLDAIWDAEPSEVVNVVNQCGADGLLSDWVKPMDMWRLLNENGLYAPSHQNWSKACNIKSKSR